jgi:small-conductance mechanosensitive channel
MEIFDEWAKLVVPWLLKHGVKVLIIIAGIFILNKISKRFIEKMVRIAVVSDRYLSAEEEKMREDTLIRIFNLAISIIIVILGIMMVLQEVGVPIGPLMASAGIVGLAFGFGGQYLVRDIISGFFIILENQYRIGDVVNFDGTGGLVEDISLRMTTLRDNNGTVHHIPHGDIKRVSNLSKNFSRINLDVRVSYNSKLDHVIEVVNRVGKELSEDPAFKDSFITPPQFLRVDDFAESAIIIKILGDTQPLKQWELTGELRKRLKIAFDKEGIEIPLPQRIVHNAT